MHTQREREKLIARVRRIRGQIEAVERAIEGEKGCYEVLQTVRARLTSSSTSSART
jgi:DNA-binding FrmR family transcriptional regulator